MLNCTVTVDYYYIYDIKNICFKSCNMKNETNDNKFSNYMLILNKWTESGKIKAEIVVDGTEGHLVYKDKERTCSTFNKLRKCNNKTQRQIIIDDMIDMISKKFEFDFIDKQTFVYIVTLSTTMDLDILLANVHVTHFLKKYHFEMQWLMF